ncbi:unnamed protein product, partial [Protopolystoma xenopodis]
MGANSARRNRSRSHSDHHSYSRQELDGGSLHLETLSEREADHKIITHLAKPRIQLGIQSSSKNSGERLGDYTSTETENNSSAISDVCYPNLLYGPGPPTTDLRPGSSPLLPVHSFAHVRRFPFVSPRHDSISLGGGGVDGSNSHHSYSSRSTVTPVGRIAHTLYPTARRGHSMAALPSFVSSLNCGLAEPLSQAQAQVHLQQQHQFYHHWQNYVHHPLGYTCYPSLFQNHGLYLALPATMRAKPPAHLPQPSPLICTLQQVQQANTGLFGSLGSNILPLEAQPDSSAAELLVLPVMPTSNPISDSVSVPATCSLGKISITQLADRPDSSTLEPNLMQQPQAYPRHSTSPGPSARHPLLAMYPFVSPAYEYTKGPPSSFVTHPLHSQPFQAPLTPLHHSAQLTPFSTFLTCNKTPVFTPPEMIDAHDFMTPASLFSAFPIHDQSSLARPVPTPIWSLGYYSGCQKGVRSIPGQLSNLNDAENQPLGANADEFYRLAADSGDLLVGAGGGEAEIFSALDTGLASTTSEAGGPVVLVGSKSIARKTAIEIENIRDSDVNDNGQVIADTNADIPLLTKQKSKWIFGPTECTPVWSSQNKVVRAGIVPTTLEGIFDEKVRSTNEEERACQSTHRKEALLSHIPTVTNSCHLSLQANLIPRRISPALNPMQTACTSLASLGLGTCVLASGGSMPTLYLPSAGYTRTCASEMLSSAAGTGAGVGSSCGNVLEATQLSN